jgi:hypothetical protein
MRRDLTSHVWVVLYTSKASYAELLALVTLAAAGPQFANEADEDEAHDLLRFLIGARGEFEGAGAPPRAAAVPLAPVAVAPVTPVTPEPVIAVPVAPAPVIAAPIVAAPVIEAPPPVAAVTPLVEAPVVATPAVVTPAPVLTKPAEPTTRARFADTTIPGNLPPMRRQGDLPPLRWGGSSDDSYYDASPEPEGRMAIVAVIVCLLTVLLFGGALWRYQYVQRKQAEVNQQRQQQLQRQESQPASASNPSTTPTTN